MEANQVKLHGMWASSYVYAVIWVLKLKGIRYDYIEEDLSNKSSSLLKYNPIHKKVPVLVHNGKPVAESTVILQYIDETWPDQQNPLLPQDPYEKSIALFWSSFADQKDVTFYKFFLSSEEDREKISTELLEILKTIQNQALGDKKFFGGDKIGFLDLRFGLIAHWFEAVQEVVGVQIVEPNTLPQLYQWIRNFKQETLIKENLPDYEAFVAYLKRLKA